MFKKKVIILFSIFLISFTTASLSISPNPLDISQTINSENTYSFSLTNNYNFKISDFTFSGLSEHGFSFPEIEINPNESQTIDFTIQPSSSFHGQVTSKVSFKFLVELSEETETHEVNITDPSGFIPNYLPVRQGDSVKFTNNHEVEFDVVIESQTYVIPVNSSITHLFNTLGTINYYDLSLGYSGVVEVLNQTTQEKAHNYNYDVNWILNLELISNPTNLTLDLSKDIFEIESGKFKKGLLTIINTGDTEKADRIHLTSNEWITFNKNEFDINPSEEEWVEFTITPILFSSNSTNMSYEIDIVVKGSNTKEYVERINVFVPYKSISTDFGDSDIDTMNWLLNVFCPQFPTSFLCNQSVGSSGNGSVIYRDADIPINVSKKVIYDIKKDILKIRDANARTNNELKILADKWGVTIPELMNMLNNSVTKQIDNEEKSKSNWNAIWIIGFFVFMIGISGAVIKIVNKKSYKKYLKEGAFEYRK